MEQKDAGQNNPKRQAFDLALGKGEREISPEEIQEATLVLDRMGLGDNDPAWWFYAAQSARTADVGRMVQIGNMEIAVQAMQKIDQEAVTRGVRLLSRTERLAAHLAQNDKVMGIFNRNFENGHLKMVATILVLVIAGAFAGGWFAH